MLPSADHLIELFRSITTIAVVGASFDESKQAHRIPRYLRSQGYRILPVNPRSGELFGEPTVVALSEVDGPIDAVQVFRPAEEAPDLAREAIAVGARVFWLQLGIVSAEAERIARAAGLTVVMDACMGAVHKKLRRSHGLEGPAQS